MGFFNQRCPNCGKSVAKNADFCNACGCPSASAWATCTRCGASVGADSQFCWKCGEQQDTAARRQIYADRWQRSPGDFAIRVDLVIPQQALHHGLLVEDGTLALLFRNGTFQGTLEPGYHQFDNVFQRFMGSDRDGLSHAILLDAQSAEVDFYLDGITTQDSLRVEVRVRVLFKVTDPKMFCDRFLTGRTTFTQQDLSDAFHADLRTGVQESFGARTLSELLDAPNIREIIEEGVLNHLTRAFAGAGLKSDGVRLADLTGEVVESLREKMAEFRRRTLEREFDSRLSDALRDEKVRLFRNEQELNDYYEQVSHELGFRGAERGQERKKFSLEAEKRLELLGAQLDWSVRREKVAYEEEEARFRRRAEIEDRKEYLGSELEEVKARGEVKRTENLAQSQFSLEEAKIGVEALRLVKEAKNEARVKEQEIDLEGEKRRLELRGNANVQALMATLTGEQADRVLKLAEMQMRQGMTPEQSLAFVAEKAPEHFAPAVAEALKAKFAGPTKAD